MQYNSRLAKVKGNEDEDREFIPEVFVNRFPKRQVLTPWTVDDNDVENAGNIRMVNPSYCQIGKVTPGGMIVWKHP